MFKFMTARVALKDPLLIVGISIMLISSAFAQIAAAPVMVDKIDLSWLTSLLVQIAAISIPVFLGLVGTWAQAHFKVAKDSAASATIDLAVTAGTQVVAAALKDVPASTSIAVKNAAINKWVTTLSQGTQAAMALRGTTADTIAKRIDGALTLALTPPVTNVTVTSPAEALKPAVST